MSRCGGRQRPIKAIVCAMTAAAVGALAFDAPAFELKRTSHGQPLHWNASQITYVIDPTVEEGVRGSAAAVSSAVCGWSHVGGGPAVSTAVGSDEAKPGLDGRNSVIFARHGFAPAGDALAVTVTSYDEMSGVIVDSDIVINGVHPYAVLDASAHASSGATPVATDGSSDDDDSLRPAPFDIVHVVSHEAGHTLGLADEKDKPASLMYAYTTPGDASVRLLSNDDVDGLDALYGTAGSAASSQGGCGQSSVAGSRTRTADVWWAAAIVALVGVRLVSRRRARAAARIALPMGAALIALVAWPGPARSATPASSMLADAVARVTRVSTSNAGGLFETTIDLVPSACRHDPCPAVAQAHAWEGTLGGITQLVGGQEAIPRVGDNVDIAFVAASERSEAAATQAAVVAVRH